MTRIAKTDPSNGNIVYKTMDSAHPGLQTETVNIEASKKSVVADGKDHLILSFQLGKRDKDLIREKRDILIQIQDGVYALTLDKNGQAEVEISATETGELVIQAQEPPGDFVFIELQSPVDAEKPVQKLGKRFVFEG